MENFEKIQEQAESNICLRFATKIACMAGGLLLFVTSLFPLFGVDNININKEPIQLLGLHASAILIITHLILLILHLTKQPKRYEIEAEMQRILICKKGKIKETKKRMKKKEEKSEEKTLQEEKELQAIEKYLDQLK